MSNTALYNIALTLVHGLGYIGAKRLLSYCGSAEEIFKSKKSLLLNIPEIRERSIEQLHDPAVLVRAEKELKFVEKSKIKLLFYSDDAYPRRLRHCADSPLLLYFKGETNFNAEKVIAIVGTRDATDYGKQMTQNLVADMAAYQVSVISGMAYGIDIYAHRAALQNNLETVGVLAHGLDRLYPFVHKSTADKMLEQGGLLTEFMSDTIPDRENFPKRNRIVAGMCDAVIVVEAGLKGGALITANIANSYSRDVFAVPGRLNDTYSEGCNRLIKTNQAALIESGKDLAYILNWDNEVKKPLAQQKLFVELSSEEEKVVNVLREKGHLPIDELTYQSEFPMSKVAGILLNLEFNGLVKSLPGKVYQLS